MNSKDIRAGEIKVAAVIGTRTPGKDQIKAVQDFIGDLAPSAVVVSGCADGIDSAALKAAQKRGLKTIGCVPWQSYNKHVQEYCSEVVCIDRVPEDIKQKAFASVRDLHPVGDRCLKRAVFLLHARNYLIVHNADFVFALPDTSKPGYGGTGQGIRVADALGIACEIYGADGNKSPDPYVNLKHSLDLMMGK